MHNIIQNSLNCMKMNQLQWLVDDNTEAETDNRICLEFQVTEPARTVSQHHRH